MIQIAEDFYFACDECPLMSQESLKRRLNNALVFGDSQFDHLGCDKVASHFYAGGYCEDAFYQIKNVPLHTTRKSGRLYRRKMREKKNKNCLKLTATSKRKIFYKKYCSRLVRRSPDILNGSQYKRLFGFRQKNS